MIEPNDSLEQPMLPRRRRNLYMAITVAAAVFLVAVLFGALVRPRSSAVLQGSPAPDFELTIFNGEFKGQRISLSELRGKVVVLNVWASWCVGCETEMDLLEQAWRAYRERGVMFLGVDYLDTDAKGLAYLARFGTTYPNGPDVGSRIYQAYQCTGVPETFFIDQQGIIQHVQIGPLNAPQLYGLLDRLLAAGGS